jgi:hypothetical protein
MAEHSVRFSQDRVWAVEGAGHVLALAADAERYALELKDFLSAALGDGGAEKIA